MNARHPPLSPLAPELQFPIRRSHTLLPRSNGTLVILLHGPVPTRTLALGTIWANGGSLPVLGMATQNLSARRPHPQYKNINTARTTS